MLDSITKIKGISYSIMCEIPFYNDYYLYFIILYHIIILVLKGILAFDYIVE